MIAKPTQPKEAVDEVARQEETAADTQVVPLEEVTAVPPAHFLQELQDAMSKFLEDLTFGVKAPTEEVFQEQAATISHPYLGNMEMTFIQFATSCMEV